MAVPAGVIVGWPSTAGTIPSGWDRVTTLDGKFLKGVPDAVTDPGTTGGASTHTHTTSNHTHPIGTHTHGDGTNTTPTATVTDRTGAGGAEQMAAANHTHAITVSASTGDTGTANPTSGSASNDPANETVIWIESDGTPDGIPDGAITWLDDTSLPSGWTQHSAGNARFLKGAAAAGNGGGTGGAATHTHTGGSHTHSAAHTHSASAGVASPSVASPDTFARGTPANHAHTMSTSSAGGTSGSSDLAFSTDNLEPPYYTLALAENTSGGELNAVGMIAVWLGTIASIPDGWVLCDGNNGTPDLMGKYIKSATTLASDVGDTGGSTSHTHTGSDHTHSIGSHTHTISYTAANDNTSGVALSPVDAVASPTHDHNDHASDSATGTTGAGAPNAASSSHEPPYAEVAFIQFQGTILIDMTGAGGLVLAGTGTVSVQVGSTASVPSNIVIEWDFDNDGDFDEDVEDITDYVMSLETETGRDWPSLLTGKAGPGQLKATLLNEDDRFNYFNTSSPLNTGDFSLKTGRKIRVRTSTASNPDPTLLARDRFTRSNGALGDAEVGGSWSGPLTNDFTIVNKEASASSEGNEHIAVLDVGVADYYAQVKLAEVGAETEGLTGSVVGLVYRYQDSNDYSLAVLDVDAAQLQLIDVVAGTPSTVDTAAVEVYDHMTIGVLVVDDAVTLYLEGIEVASGTAIQTDETEVGFYADWSTGQTTPAIDSFYVWSGLPQEVSGVLWTGDISDVVTMVTVGPKKYATISAEGPLARAAGQEVRPPGSVTGRKTGLLIGNTLAMANLLHPPMPSALGEGDITTGPFGMESDDAIEVVRQFEETEFGFLYETPEGYIGFDSRTARDSVGTSATFSDEDGWQYSYGTITPFDWKREVFNRVSAGIAQSVPSGITTTNPSLSGNAALTMPATVTAGDLLIVIMTANAAGLRAPVGWVDLYGQGDSVLAGRAFARVADGSEDGTSVEFGDSASTLGAAFIYRITDWYGSIEGGVSVGDVTPGVEPTPVFPDWGPQPSLLIANLHTFGAAAPTADYPVGYTNGQTDNDAAGVGTGRALFTAYRLGAVSVESPAYSNLSGSNSAITSVVVAVRGFNGDPPVDDGVDQVQEDDFDSQLDHNAIRTYRNESNLFADEAAATTYAQLVLSKFADDRPILELSFVATKNAGYRSQAVNRRVSDKIRVVANNDVGLGIAADFFIESINHRWSDAGLYWETTWTLSPA